MSGTPRLKTIRERKPSARRKRGHHGIRAAMGKDFADGVVRYYIEHVPSNTGQMWHRALSPQKLVEIIREGLSYTELHDLRTSLNVPTEKLAPMLGISKATIHRYTDTSKRFDLTTSDKIVRFARLFGKAIEVFGDREDARRWMNSHQNGLGGAIPLEYASTEIGAREVENLLGRIQYGVYS